jgi:hypothetical protein
MMWLRTPETLAGLVLVSALLDLRYAERRIGGYGNDE